MKNKKIVTIGGGTGMFTLLSGLKEYTKNITAIISTADNGGSSGILRDELGLLPVGDIRNCLIALSESKELMYKLFKYRFEKGSLAGHSIGNLLMAALVQINKGDFLKTLEQFSSLLSIKGKVLPATTEKITLYAKLCNGKIIKGEADIDGYYKYSHIIDVEKLKKRAKISNIFIYPKATALLQSLKAIKEADLIILGPGSLYTSIISNLLVNGISEAIVKSKAEKVYVCNIMTQIGETDDYSASMHLNEIEKYLGKRAIDYIILNNGSTSQDIIEKYRKEYKQLIYLDTNNIKNVKIIKKNLIKGDILARHDPQKLANAIISIL
jgi:uncharacterized cofD-like protein